MSWTVAGIGQCSWDYLARIDAYPSPDSKKEVSEWVEEGGGPVATALVALARFGVQCRLYGVVGDDPEGVKILASLRGAGIDASGVCQRRGAASQTAFITVEEGSGRRTIFWRRAGGEELIPDEMAGDVLAGVDFLLLDGLMADVSLWGAREARRRGIPVMLDAGRVRPGMLEIARECDYLVAAEQFALDVGWDGDPERFHKRAAELCSGTVTITLGDRGCVTFCRGEIISVPAFAVKVTDTTGAGDVFHGGYLYGLLRGWTLRDTLTFASAVAAMKCTRMGGRAGIPTHLEAAEFLAQRNYRGFAAKVGR